MSSFQRYKAMRTRRKHTYFYVRMIIRDFLSRKQKLNF